MVLGPDVLSLPNQSFQTVFDLILIKSSIGSQQIKQSKGQILHPSWGEGGVQGLSVLLCPHCLPSSLPHLPGAWSHLCGLQVPQDTV